MTDRATLRAMAKAMGAAIMDESSRRSTFIFPPFWVFEICARVAQSSWAKEKEKLERYATAQLSSAQRACAQADKLQEEKEELERQLAEADECCKQMADKAAKDHGPIFYAADGSLGRAIARHASRSATAKE